MVKGSRSETVDLRPGSEYRGPGVGDLGPDTEVWEWRPGSGNQWSETRDLRPGAGTRRPGSGDRKIVCLGIGIDVGIE
jgi:hypothetical protein